jgi:hypothetical protein
MADSMIMPLTKQHLLSLTELFNRWRTLIDRTRNCLLARPITDNDVMTLKLRECTFQGSLIVHATELSEVTDIKRGLWLAEEGRNQFRLWMVAKHPRQRRVLCIRVSL